MKTAVIGHGGQESSDPKAGIYTVQYIINLYVCHDPVEKRLLTNL
jgi:hypothetical protein